MIELKTPEQIFPMTNRERVEMISSMYESVFATLTPEQLEDFIAFFRERADAVEKALPPWKFYYEILSPHAKNPFPLGEDVYVFQEHLHDAMKCRANLFEAISEFAKFIPKTSTCSSCLKKSTQLENEDIY